MTSAKHRYQLLDSGDGARLEQVGPWRVRRPAAEAIWRPGMHRREWEKADARFFRGRDGEENASAGGPISPKSSRSRDGEGVWELKGNIPNSWQVELAGLVMNIRLTPFGHIGIFPEQAESWLWASRLIRDAGRPVSVLCLFAYTGGSTLVCAAAGARVCHVDASKPVVEWARRNAASSGLVDRPIRWIVEDVIRFVKREIRRGDTFDGIILDPPSFGRGTKGEVWKIQDDLPQLLGLCRQLLSSRPLFVLMHVYTPWLPLLSFHNLMEDALEDIPGLVEHGELFIVEQSRGRKLPRGGFIRWVPT